MYQCTCVHWSCWQQWRGWCRPAVATFYAVLLVVAIPLLIYHITSSPNHARQVVWFVAGLFVLLTLPIFLAGLVQHILNYTQPHLQKHIIRILWIVPIYSLNSFIALTFQESAIYLDTIRECYEAYVLYNFLCYLCNFLTSEYDLVAELEARPTVTHHVPCCCIPPWPKGAVFLRRCRIGVLQYVVVRVLVTIIALITQLSHVYHRGDLKKKNAWIYLSIVNGLSQACALYSLIYFYRGTRELLKPLHPVGKFMSIKAIIFAMFWQTILVSILIKTNAIPSKWDKYDLQEGLLNLLVVIEMVLFAVAHYFAFSHKPYIDPAAAQIPCIGTCLRMLDVRDVAGDVKEHFVDPLPRPRFRRGGQVSSTEDSPLLSQQLGPNGVHHVRGNLSANDSDATLQAAAERSEAAPLSDLSYDVLTYKDLNSQTRYGQRANMIANACRTREVKEEEGEGSQD